MFVYYIEGQWIDLRLFEIEYILHKHHFHVIEKR